MILPFLPYTPSTLLWISIMQQSLYLKRRVPWPTTLSKIFLLKVKNKLVVNWKGEGTSLSTVFLFFPEKTSMTTLPTTWLLPGDLGGLPSDMEKTEEDIGNCPLSLTCGSFKKKKKKNNQGLPWWRSGWQSACQCRGHWFEPWSGRIPHAAEQLGPWATTTEPACLEPVPHNKTGRDSERPAHRYEEWPLLAATRESPRTETKTQHSHK